MIKESWQDPDAGYDFTEEEIEKIKWLDRLRENRIEIEKIIERIEWHANAATSRKTALAEVFIKKEELVNKGWERHVNEIVILEKDLDLLNENEVSLFEEIQEAISGVFDSKLRQVLKMRHINLMGFREISEKIHYSRQYVYKLYRKALLKFMIP